MRLPRISLLLACATMWSCTALIGTKDIYLDTGAGVPAVALEGGLDVSPPPVDANPSDSPAACTDVMTSELNCGKCGHSCLGGKCVAGQCQPFALATGISARHIAVDKNHVYWTEPNTARAFQVNKDGTQAVQLGGGTNNLLVGLGIDGANVFWTSRDEIVLRCKIGGCANTPAVVTNIANYINGLAVDATNVYWLEDTSPSRVRKIDKTATLGTGTLVAMDDVGAPAGTYAHLVTDGQFVYWTASDGMVRRAPTSGSGPITVVGKGQGSGNGLAVDDVNVYWSAGDSPGGTINVAPKNGATLGVPLAASQNLPLGLAVDQTSIYWVNAALGISPTSGVIMTCTLAACTPKPLAVNQRTPVNIAVDDTAIYWTNFDTGNPMGGVMKLAK